MAVETKRPIDDTDTRQMKYANVVRFENAARGSYGDLDYNPVFRSSALFFAVRSATLDTVLSFMNYWKFKNANPDISALVTVRDRDGVRRTRQFFSVVDPIYRLALSELLPEQTDFEGSIEIEIISTHDLKYPMPAIQAFYLSPDGVTFVHANQRTFNGIEDLDRNQKFNGWQSGFDIYANDEISGFIGVVNGQRAVKDAAIRMQLFNVAGARKDISLQLGELPAYASRRVELSRLSEARTHLGDARGWCKVIIDTDAVFNRLLCGNLTKDGRRLSVTHSYYDLIALPDYVPASEIKPDEYTAILPLPMIDGLDLDVVFYPIYSQSKLRIDIERRDAGGKITHVAEGAGRFNVEENRSLVLEVRRTFKERHIPDTGSCNIVVNGIDESQIPARLTVGINYRHGPIGSNLSGTVFTTIGYGVRARFYAWGPAMVQKGASNHVLLCHLDKKRNSTAACEITVTLYGRQGLIGHRTLTTANGSSTSIHVEEWLQNFGYQPIAGEIVWYDATASRHVYSAYQVHRSGNGLIGCDHSY